MSLSRDEVAHIARLARLELTEEELEKYREQLSAILDHVARLSELDTSGITPEASPTEEAAPRPDEPRPGLPPESLEANAPEWSNGQFRVPPIFE